MIGVRTGTGRIGGGATLSASPTRFLATVAQGALIASLSRPFGAGTTFATVGAVPGQLTLTAGTITKGAGAAVVGTVYSVKVRASSADGKREAAETLSFRAIAAAPALGALTLSATAFALGTPANGTINGATAGSTVGGAGLPTGFTINGAARTWAWDGAGAIGVTNITLSETLAGATGSPRASVIAITVSNIPAFVAPTAFSRSNYAQYPNQTKLRDMAGWEALAVGAYVGPEQDDAVFRSTFGGHLWRNDNGVSNDPRPGKYLYRKDAGQASIMFRVISDYASTASVSFGANSENRIEVSTNGYAATNFVAAASADRSVAPPIAADARLPSTSGVGPWTGFPVREVNFPTETLDYLRWGTKVYVRRNRVPFAEISNVFATGNFVGYGTGGEAFRLIKDDWLFKPRTLLKINPHETNFGTVRFLDGSTLGAADVPFGGTWEGEKPAGLWYWIEDAFNHIERRAPTWAAATINDNGTFSFMPRIPCGLNGTRDMRVGIRTSGSAAGTDDYAMSAQHFTVDFVVDGIGQSDIASAFGATNLGYIADHPGGYGYAIGEGGSIAKLPIIPASGWLRGTTETNSYDRSFGLFTKYLSEILNCPVRIVSTSLGARLAGNLVPGGADWNAVSAHVDHNAPIACFIGSQIASEIDAGGMGTWLATWRDVGIPAYRARAGQLPGTVVPVFWGQNGVNGLAANNSDPVRQSRTRQGRALTYDLIAQVPDMYLGAHYVGCTTDAGGDWTDAANSGARYLRRFAKSIAWRMFGLGTDGVGPGFGPATRTNNVIDIPLIKRGATSITGANLSGFRVATDQALTTPLAITSANVVDIGGQNYVIRIVLAANPGVPVWLANYLAYNPDAAGETASWVVGQYADGVTIEMEPIAVPMVTTS